MGEKNNVTVSPVKRYQKNQKGTQTETVTSLLLTLGTIITSQHNRGWNRGATTDTCWLLPNSSGFDRLSPEDKVQEGSWWRENDAHPHCLISVTELWKPPGTVLSEDVQHSTGLRGSAGGGESDSEDQGDTGGQSWDQAHCHASCFYLLV